ncbi:MAG TPA: acyl-CoA dehydrogenase family protein, partial [Acidimicrobiia bacterium]|nr:acyl-CoA dehydrogenase family protein [Acidimicrobiia bacterium]
MELDFEPDQEDLRDAIRSVLTKESPVSLARAVVEDDRAPVELWKTFVDLGWPSLTVPEEYGGVGLGPIEAAILAEELGRVIAPGALFPTVTQFVPVVRECGTPDQQARWLGAVAAGECAGALAIGEATASFDPATVGATYRLDGDELELSGTKHHVVEGDTVDELVVVARGDGGVRAIVVPVADVETTREHTLDDSRHLVTVALDGVRVSTDRLLGKGDATDALRRAVEEATLGLALEMVGTAQTILDVT